MYTLTLICCVLFVTIASTNAGLSPEQIAAMQTIMNDCKAKTGATDDDVLPFMRHDIPESTIGLCFAACIKKTIGILKADNTIDLIKVEELVSPMKESNTETYDAIMKVANNCAASVEVLEDECLTTRNVLQCLKDEIEANQLKIDFMSMSK